MSQVTSSASSAVPEYWRSLEELADTPEFARYVEAEFPSRAAELVDPLSRRRFIQVMGASLALAGVSGCDFVRWPKENILPFASRPQHRNPGTTVAYATSFDFAGAGAGLLVTSFDGRPIKVDGNPQHPESLGASTPFMQASILDLYDPDRSQTVLKVAGQGDAVEGTPSTWEEVEAELEPRFKELKAAQGKGLAIVAGASSSRTTARLLEKLRRDLPQALFATWEPLNGDAAREGAKRAFGRPLRAQLSLAKSDVIVSLDADLLGCAEPASLRYSREFARRRRPENGKLTRLYVVEGGFSLTGGMADHRLATRAAEVGAVAMKLAAELVAQGLAAPEAVKAWVKDRGAATDDPQRAFVQRLARDLLASKGAALIAVGPRQPASLHALACLLNGLLESTGKTVVYTDDPDGDRPSSVDALAAVTKAMNDGAVQTALVLGTNPLHDAPSDLGFAAAFARVAQRVHLGHRFDETGRASTWHLPMAHYLESWGDARAWDGTLSAVQPLIAPLFAGRTPAELLALVVGESKRARKGYELVRKTLAEVTGLKDVEFERAWRGFLHDGVLAGSAFAAVDAQVKVEDVVAAQTGAPAALAAGELELVLTPDSKLWDGRWANNAWLQEFPEPLTKLTWDNALLIHPATARDLGVKGDDLVRLTVKQDGKTLGPIEVPTFVLPGMPRRTVALSLGYGRGAAAGVVGKGVGADAYPLRTTSAMHVTSCALETTGKSYYLATTQDHHAIRSPIGDSETQDRVFGKRIEFGRGADGAIVAKESAPSNYVAPLIREATVEEYEKDPRFAKKIVGPDPVKTQMWDPPQRFGEGYQWGMAIDLSACTGCGACVLACVAENNVPMVGKSEVARGREMHWLRIDRYFKGDPYDGERREGDPTAAEGHALDGKPVQVAYQPMLCMQCENAPCEAVCPVGATTHSEEGLNDMAYNRCVGTRYCANNCPYKVRRFNYFWNHHGPFHPRSNPITMDGQVLRKLPKPAIAVPELPILERMQLNPDVTVRSRGVMEKCTYCVQRIQNVTIRARNEQRPVRDGEIVTACQQACPTETIVFGNLNDPESAVSKLQKRDRTYALLAELATKPRTQYLAKLRNPGQEA